MEKEFIPYTEALALKELGFDEPCFVYEYTGDTGNNVNHTIETSPSLAKNHNKDSLCVSKPTWKQAFRWFREKYDYDGYFFSNTSYRYRVVIKKIYTMENLVDIMTDTYEEAELECLKKLIEIVKNK
jgi:hypothetical protein